MLLSWITINWKSWYFSSYFNTWIGLPITALWWHRDAQTAHLYVSDMTGMTQQLLSHNPESGQYTDIHEILQDGQSTAEEHYFSPQHQRCAAHMRSLCRVIDVFGGSDGWSGGALPANSVGSGVEPQPKLSLEDILP